ncbi:hypothetical protein M527_26480 [Sphingobium indicum IP26]|uniref:DUF4173 domain-containing protein n=1 Tax=Sphingobium indicum F2 TaxID=1450518 RepID=A0A8E0WRG0_9SPHN|nr:MULTISPECIES: DUF4173 domain-containing protein [Sphingobium]EPR14927.1 hypothetical protein M527_26480 [Sphingobium indicum IP26]KER35899.1 hypothetical protein AL00_14245 [Sphingobium indicum F2]
MVSSAVPPSLPLLARFRWKLAPALLIVGIGDWLFYQRHLHGGYLGLFALAVLLALLAGRPVLRRDRRAWAALSAAALFALALIYDASLLAWLLFWTAAGVAALIPATARFDDGWRWFQRLVWLGLRAPFGPLIDLKRLLKLRAAGRAGRWSLHAALGTLTLPVAGSAVILTLFSAANPLIERFFSSLLLPDLSPELMGRLAFWALLFAMIWGLLRPRLARVLLPGFSGGGDWALPGVSVASVTLSLILFNLIFALQNLMDAAWLWGWAPMPRGMTMADYAHRGAYPLIATALLAALFVLVTLRPGSETARTGSIRRLVMLWIGQNIFLVASSMLRTADYIDAYSMTRLRIAALVWMALVGFGLASICWRLLRERSAAWLVNVNLAAAGLVLAVICFIDLGAVAAQWNVRHAREVGGRGVALDLCYLGGLGDSALLPLLSLERRPGLQPEFRERVQAVRLRLHDRLEAELDRRWTWVGQRRLDQARAMLSGAAPAALTLGQRDCAGRPVRPRPTLPALTGERGK